MKRAPRPIVCTCGPKHHVLVPVPEDAAAVTQAAVVRQARLAAQTYLTPDEAAEYTRRPSRRAFLQWADRALIPKCRMGNRILYFRKDLDAAIQPSHVQHAHRRRA